MIDRTRLAFLGDNAHKLSHAVVTVVGGGGGGSHIAQQLAHLAVGTVVIIDPDIIERSNINRLPCCRYTDLRRPKAIVLAERLDALGSRMVPVVARAEDPLGRRWLERSDIVIGAVDGIRTRSNVERICRNALVPYIDIGLGIDVDDNGAVRAIGGQVVTSLIDGPCLRCVDVITDAAIIADREEYVVGAPDQQVISMNGVLASQAVNHALALITDYAPSFPVPTIVRFDGLLYRMLPDPEEIFGRCSHFALDSAGWSVVLPYRRIRS